jgi:hypothetical protein
MPGAEGKAAAMLDAYLAAERGGGLAKRCFHRKELAADRLTVSADTAEPGSKPDEALNLLASWAATHDRRSRPPRRKELDTRCRHRRDAQNPACRTARLVSTAGVRPTTSTRAVPGSGASQNAVAQCAHVSHRSIAERAFASLDLSDKEFGALSVLVEEGPLTQQRLGERQGWIGRRWSR